MIELETMLKEANQLKALPQSAVRLSSLLANADWVLKDIVHAVEYDPALTGRLLRLANSSAMGGRHRITSVSDAVLRVGPGPLLSLTLASAVRQELQKPLSAYGLEERDLWRHSVATALAADRSRSFCQVAPPPGSFVAALLHDIGKLILDRHLKGILDQPEGHELQPGDELCLLGTHHGVLGGAVASHWRLSQNVTDAIAQHHDPSSASSDEGRLTACFVALADCVAHRVDSDRAPVLARYVVQSVRIDRAGFEALCDETGNALDDILEIYS